MDTEDLLSPDRRFRLRREAGGGVVLALAASGRSVLDLRAAGARIDVCNFDVNGRALLHLRLSREDGSLTMYPATLDLDTGLYYHGDPRQAQAPVGQAADLERIVAGATPSQHVADTVRWPAAGELAASALPAPLPTLAQAQAQAPAIPAVDIEPTEWVSVDGTWRIRAEPHLRIADTVRDQAVLDLRGTAWECAVRMNPAANQAWINIAHPDARTYLDVFVDLDLCMYWECDAHGVFLPGGRLAAPLVELQARLSRMRLIADP